MLSAALSLAASLSLVAAVSMSEAEELRLPISPWALSAFQASPSLDVDLLAATISCLVALLALLALAFRGTGTSSDTASVLWIAAAASFFVVAGRTPLGLVMGWLALDLAIVLALQGGRWALVAGQLGLLAAILGLSALPPGTQSLSRDSLTSTTPTVRYWLLVAGFVRMGLYPIWWTVPPSRPYMLWASVSARLAPTICGLYILLRAAGITPYGQAFPSAALLPALVAVVGGAVLAWLADDRAAALDWTTVHHAGLAFMAATVGGPMGVYFALVLLIDLAISRAVLYGAVGARGPRLGRLAAWLATACALGLPPTVGFAGRWLLYRELLNWDLTTVLAVTVFASLLASASLVTTVSRPRTGSNVKGHVAILLLAVSTLGVVLGVGFDYLSTWLAVLADYEPHLPWADIASSLRYAGNAQRSVLLMSAILVPGLIGAVIGQLRRRPTEYRSAARHHWSNLLRLNRAAGAIGVSLVAIGGFVQRAAGQREGRQDMAWTMLAVTAISAAVVAVQARPEATPPLPAPLTPLLLLGATAIAATGLLARSYASHLVALGAAYIYASGLLALLAGLQVVDTTQGAPTIVATIKLLSGGLVVGILAISVVQLPFDRRLADAAQRLHGLLSYEATSTRRVLPAIALAVAVVISYGIHSYSLPPGLLPDALLQPALIIAAGGILSVVFAVSVVHLVVGVFMAMIGFEMVYARLDPGLLVTGGLATLQLMLALVASYFVGAAGADAGEQDPG